ncbi:hypothetical protein Acid7E03_42790 [Acidisoma sp. 7E03]
MGRPPYILVARQMGKTNLLINMKLTRESKGELVVYLDLSNRYETARSFFRHVIDMLLETESDALRDVAETIVAERSTRAAEANIEYDRHLRRILTASRRSKLVIVFDEIDSLLGVPYSDVVLAQVRSMYFSRINYPIYDKLTYVLSGVVEPTELIKDKNISPFNIGEKIYLGDFNRTELSNFVKKAGLILSKEAEDAVFHWAAGNPRMTWDICAALEDQIESGLKVEADAVREIVSQLYLTSFDRAPVDHIRSLVGSDPQVRDAIVSIRFGKGGTLDERIRNRLYLGGITNSVVADELAIKNRIIDAALSDSWLAQIAAGRRSLLDAALDSASARRFSHAVKLFDEALRLDIELTPIQQFNFAVSLYQSGDFRRSIEVLNKVKTDPTLDTLKYDLSFYEGAAFLSLRRFEEAIPILRTARDTEAPLAKLRSEMALASALLFSGSPENALEALSVAREVVQKLEGSDSTSGSSELLSTAYFNLAQALRRVPDVDAARRALQNAQDVAPLAFRPMIILYHTYLTKDAEERAHYGRAAANLIVDERLTPTDDDDTGLSFNRRVFALALACVYSSTGRDIFLRLLDYALSALPNIRGKAYLLHELFLAGLPEDKAPFVVILNAIVENGWLEELNDFTSLEVLRQRAIYNSGEERLACIEAFFDKWLLQTGEDAFSVANILFVFEYISQAKLGSPPRLAERVFERFAAQDTHLLERSPLLAALIWHRGMSLYWQGGDRSQAALFASRILTVVPSAREDSTDARLLAIVSQIENEAQMVLEEIRGRSLTKIGRNVMVTVRNVADRTTRRSKFKFVRADILSGKDELVSIDGPPSRKDAQ